jgi:Fe2+ transport system protein B
MASDGTPLEAIENGEISNTADSGRMQAILRDMNAPGVDTNPRTQPPSMPPMQEQHPVATRQMPPSLQISQQQHFLQQQQMQQQQMQQQQMQQQQMQQQYEANQAQHYQENEHNEVQDRKKNVWSTILDNIIDPIIVSVIFFVLSLPVLHSLLGKYAAWAFSVGGQLSWLGLSVLALLAGLVFAFIRIGRSFAGL